MRQQDQTVEALELMESLLAKAPTDPNLDPLRPFFCEQRDLLPTLGETGEIPPNRSAEGAIAPRKVFAPQPRIARAAPSLQKDLQVQIGAVIDEHGCVVKPRVTEGVSPSVDAEALATVSQWVFRPSAIDGRAVAVHYFLTVNHHGR